MSETTSTLKPALSFYILGTLKNYGQKFSDIVRIFILPFFLSALGQVANSTESVPFIIVGIIFTIASAVLAAFVTIGFINLRANIEGVSLKDICIRGAKLFFPNIVVSVITTGVFMAIPLVSVFLGLSMGFDASNFKEFIIPFIGLFVISLISIIYLIPRLICAPQALAIENRRGGSAIGRSLELTQGRNLGIFWRVFLSSVVWLVISFVINFTVASSFGDSNLMMDGVQLPIAGILVNNLFGMLLLAPLSIIFGVNLYEDLASRSNPSSASPAPTWVWVLFFISIISAITIAVKFVSGFN